MTSWLYALPLGAYLYGSVPFGFLAARWLRGVDIRKTGSGNIGATNAARALGFRFFPILFLLDASKGLLPTLTALDLVGPGGAYVPPPLVVFAGLAAILGHVFPLYLGFKGGKAVATSAGSFVVVAPYAVAAAAAVWGIVFALWRYVSLASMAAAVALPVAICLTCPDPFGRGIFLTATAIAGGLFVIYLHRANIRRLLSGAENKVGRGRIHRGSTQDAEKSGRSRSRSL
jgi:acyl phosphate:glycerol-3-phosphate acyltransferase